MERERKTERTPQVGDHVTLMGTNVTGDVRRVDRSQGHDRVSVKVTGVLGASRKSKAARAFRGAWITCRPELLVPQTADPAWRPRDGADHGRGTLYAR